MLDDAKINQDDTGKSSTHTAPYDERAFNLSCCPAACCSVTFGGKLKRLFAGDALKTEFQPKVSRGEGEDIIEKKHDRLIV